MRRSLKLFGWNFPFAENMKTSFPRGVMRGESIGVALRYFCSTTPQRRLPVWSRTDDVLLTNLQSALLKCKDDEVWGIFCKFKNVHGSLTPGAMSKLISGLSYSLDRRTLPKACHIVFRIAKENPGLLQAGSMFSFCLTLARAEMPAPASKILRLMLMKKKPPAMDVLYTVFMHMVKTDAGTHLASNILLEFCDHFRKLCATKPEQAVSMKPNATIFNLVLEACLKIGSSLKAEQMIEAMARTGVVADLHSVLLFSHVYEMNGQIDEMRKLKVYIDRVSVPLAQHYYPFYNKLLRLQLKFDDINAVIKLLEDIYFHLDSHRLKQDVDLTHPHLVPIGSPFLLEGLKSRVAFELLQKDSVLPVTSEEDLLESKNGNLILTSKGLAQLVAKFMRCERIGDLSKLLAAIKKTGNTESDSICCDVIHGCVYSGFLETAHDILDDMETVNVFVPSTTYMLLLNAYYEKNMPKEAETLAKQIERAGLTIGASDEKNSAGLISPTSRRQSELSAYLVQEMRTKDQTLAKLYELNSSIYFFCKAKMFDDARKIYAKMKEINIQPTVQTFSHFIQAYYSLEDYRETTILWGDIKRYTARGCSLVDRDLYEMLLLCFLRGGYFERVLEVIGLMKNHGMYADRWLYRNEFERLHRHLYKNLKVEDATTEAQRSRIEHVQAFRMWVRNN